MFDLSTKAVATIQGDGIVAAVLIAALGEIDDCEQNILGMQSSGFFGRPLGRESVKIAPLLTLEVASMAGPLSVLREVIRDVENENK